MLKAALLDTGRKAVERLGKHHLWAIPRHLRRQQGDLSPDNVRECLRELGIFISNENFSLLTEAYTSTGSPSFNVDKFLSDFSTTLLGPRRQHVVGLVIKKLDPNNTGLVRQSRLDDCYDALRHPAVLNGTREADDVTAEFFMIFRDDDQDASSPDEVGLTCEELVFYYTGVSLQTAKDEDFELRCIRSFSLDRPKFDAEDEAARLAGSRAVSRQSRMLGEGRDHPLYTTTNAEYGSTVKDDPPTPTKYGRSQKFTRNQPPRSGGATSMNM